MNPAHLSLSPSYFTYDLPALEHAASPASSSYSRSSSEWLAPDGACLPTPGDYAQPAPPTDYFGYVPAQAKPAPAAAYPWELYHPAPQRFPSTFASSSLLLTPHAEEPVAPQQTPAAADGDLDDVVFAARYPGLDAAAQVPAGPSDTVGSRNKQACVFCQSGRRKCDGNKNDLSACSVCSSSSRQCCWTKVKRLRGPNRARGSDGKPAVPSSVYRVRAAGSLLRRIEQQQKQQQRPAPAAALPSVHVEPVDFLGADGWEPSAADGFQVSADVFAPAPYQAYSYPATPRRPTQDLPSVLLPEPCGTFCGLATPVEPSHLADAPRLAVNAAPAPAAGTDSAVRLRLKQFAFPPKMTPSPEPPVTPLSASYAISAPPLRQAFSLKRSRTAADDDDGAPVAQRWNDPHLSPAAKMNAALALDLVGQRLQLSGEHAPGLALAY